MQHFDWKKYKRVFAFGCSFTQYTYPTWADIIFHETKNAECYNFGKSGMGNLGIACRIAEANTRFKFNEHDIILVMYTTFFREDRWILDRWETHGCVFNQEYYNNNFVKNYVDPIGCLIRDFAQIDMSSNYVKSLPCDSLLLRASDIDDEGNVLRLNNPELVDEVINCYSTLWNSFPTSLRETMFPNGWEIRSTRTAEWSNGPHPDIHPITIDYYNYLKTIGLNLSESTYEYVLESDNKLKESTVWEEWNTLFPEVYATHKIALF